MSRLPAPDRGRRARSACAPLVSAWAALPIALLALPAIAQDEPREEKTWYRVELIIFANLDPEAASSEAWPILPELTYPEPWRVFEDGEANRSADRPFTLVRVEDTVPDLFELYPDRSVESLLEEYERRRWLRQPNIQLEPLFDLAVPHPFALLPEEARELNAQRRRINNSAGLDVLFHGSWLQRIESQAESVPLIIDAGPRYGDYPELQGSVLLYSARYLHIATNLWLNTAGDYLDLDAGDWRMPPPPPPPEQPRPEFRPFRVDPAPDWLAVEGAADAVPAERDGMAGAEALPGADAAQRDDLAIPAGPAPLSRPMSEGAERPPHSPVSDEELQAFLDQPVRDYDFRHAILVNQQRRMRSGELHYIDHPLLGIVIKVSRYEFEPFVTAPADSDLAGVR